MRTRLSENQLRAAEVIAQGFDVPLRAVLGRRRGPPRVSRARQALMYTLWNYSRPQKTLTEVGRLLGRSRETVSHGVGVFREGYEPEPCALQAMERAHALLSEKYQGVDGQVYQSL